MKALLGFDDTVAEWIASKTGKPFFPPYTAIGVIDEAGTLRGGFVFTSYTGDKIEMSLAGDGVASRSMWRVVLNYVFEQSKCSRLQMHTRRSNKRVLRQLVKLGFHFEGIARRFYGREHGVCYSLTIDDLPTFRSRWKL